MDGLNKIFSYYDNWLAHFSKTDQLIISGLILAILIWQIIMFIKKGQWVLIAVILIIMPGAWPFIKFIAKAIWLLVKFFITRIQSNI